MAVCILCHVSVLIEFEWLEPLNITGCVHSCLFICDILIAMQNSDPRSVVLYTT